MKKLQKLVGYIMLQLQDRTRLVCHIILLLPKLVISSFSLIKELVKHSLLKTRQIQSSELASANLKKSFDYLPIVERKDGFNLYVKGVNYIYRPTGSNHNPKDQIFYQSIYAYTLGLINKRTKSVENALALHILPTGQLSSGYKFVDKNKVEFNNERVTNHELLALGLAMTNRLKENIKIDQITSDEGGIHLRDRFDYMVYELIKNDYSFLINSEDGKRDKYIRLARMRAFKKDRLDPVVKNNLMNLYPSAKTQSNDALTLLATLKVTDRICGTQYARDEYSKFIKLGYGLLAFIPNMKANKLEYIIGYYILATLSRSKVSRALWSIPLLGIWLTTYKEYNGFFTGLVSQVFPKLISEQYKQKCVDLLNEKPIKLYSENGVPSIRPEAYPATYNDLNLSDFHPKMKHQVLITSVNNEFTGNMDKTLNGLGYLSSMVVLNPKKCEEILNVKPVVDVPKPSNVISIKSGSDR